MTLKTGVARAGLVVLVALIAGCGGGASDSRDSGATSAQDSKMRALAVASPTASAGDTIQIGSLTKVAERRISRTLFEYEYSVTLSNPGAAVRDIAVLLVGTGPGTTIVDGNIVQPALGSGQSATPNDHIIIRHDRTQPFQLAALRWQVTAVSAAITKIPGQPTDLAVSALQEFVAEVSYPASQYEFDLQRGADVLRGRLVFGLHPNVTVGQVNTLLQSLGAEVVRTYAGTPVIEIRVPDPKTLAGNSGLLAVIGGNPVVSFALPTVLPQPNSIPEVFYQSGDKVGYLAHHLAIRASAAWNARNATMALGSSPPLLFVADWFGDGAISDGLLEAGSIASSAAGYVVINPLVDDSRYIYHGYHVLGIASATFNRQNDLPITGLYPGFNPLPLQIQNFASCVEGSGVPPSRWCGRTQEDQVFSLAKAQIDLGRRVVLNTSFGANQGGDQGMSAAEAEKAKMYWLHLWRGADLSRESNEEKSIFHAAAAGNSTNALASRNMGWNAAVAQGFLKNTASVENRTASPFAPYPLGCLSANSSRGGNLSAIGSLTGNNGVLSYVDKWGTADRKSGTSMAAPQVAGLASYLWTIRPDFTSQEVLEVIRSHAVPEAAACAGTEQPGQPIGSPTIDAYATILAADSVGRTAARRAILDINGDGKFDYNDAVEFLAAFRVFSGASALQVNPVQLYRLSNRVDVDISRFDLNGDGRVGGDGVSRFNLNMDYGLNRSSVYGPITYNGPSGDVAVDERNLRDVDVLCYYVHAGGIWADTPARAAQLLECRSPLTFARRYPTPQTPFLNWSPPSISAKVVQGTADVFNWSGYFSINPEESTIEFTNLVLTGWGDGIRGEFDGIVISGFSSPIDSVSVDNQMGGVVSVSHTGSEVLIGLNSQSLPQTYFQPGGKFILTVRLRQ